MSDHELHRRLAHALRANLQPNPAAKANILERVRRDAHARDLQAHGSRHSFAGMLLAAGVSSIIAVSSFAPAIAPRQAAGMTSAVIGDSVVGRFRDTLRLVRLMFDDTASRQVELIGDWGRVAMPMIREPHSRKWALTLALRDGEYRYAVLVDNTRRQGLLHVSPVGQ